MAIISGPGIPNPITPAQAKGDTNAADFQPVRIDIPTGQSNGNCLEIYKAGALVASVDINGVISCPSVTGFNAPNNEGRATTTMAADANQTLGNPALQASIIEFAGGTTLTATRNIVLPLVSGAVYAVFNNTTGAQSLQFIGASGTGVTVATGKRALIYCDGTNWVRLTADA